jgi:hypothetical protein
VYLSERKNKLGKAHKYYVPCGLPTYTYIWVSIWKQT